jgi:hypothetical protein
VRRILLALALALGLAVTGSTSAQAITGNYRPDFDHPYVGLIAFYDSSGAFVHRCSGSLLTDRVFLTAGHCVSLDETGSSLAASARIWFQQGAGADYDPITGAPAKSGYPVSGGVTAHTFYSYGFSGLTVPQTHDIGLVILDRSVTTVYPNLTRYGSLAHAGTLDRYTATHTGNTAVVTVSGYGLTYTNGNPDKVISFRSRLEALTWVIGLNSHLAGGANVQLASNPGRGGGGTCFGDSGGPTFVGGFSSDVITAVTSFGLSANVCAGTEFEYRTDQQPVIDWILAHAGSTAGRIRIV